MMKHISTLKEWYDFRQMREKVLVVALSWAVLYALFSLLFFNPLTTQKNSLLAAIKELEGQTNTWHTQLTALNQIPNTPLYREWQLHNKSVSHLETQYKFLLQTAPDLQLQKVIRTIMQPQPGITLVQIKNLPEHTYIPKIADLKVTNIYQQQLDIVIYGQYFDVLNYIQYIEKTLPSVYWNSLDYEVMQYPMAKVQMEMSILYEKKK